MKKSIIITLLIVGILLSTSFVLANSGSEPFVSIADKARVYVASLEAAQGIELLHGELLSLYEVPNSKVVVVKASVSSLITNKATVRQNYDNVIDLIKNKGFDKYDEIQYWAVSKARSGEDVKIISFTVSSKIIAAVKAKAINIKTLEKELDDLWILPSLRPSGK